MKENYMVVLSNEYFKGNVKNGFVYQFTEDANKMYLFESEEEAKKFMDSYELKSEKNNYDIYLEILDLYFCNLDDSELLYSKGIDIEEFEKRNHLILKF